MSYCKNCGKQLPNDSTFCPGCGTKVGTDESGGSNIVTGQQSQQKKTWNFHSRRHRGLFGMFDMKTQVDMSDGELHIFGDGDKKISRTGLNVTKLKSELTIVRTKTIISFLNVWYAIICSIGVLACIVQESMIYLILWLICLVLDVLQIKSTNIILMWKDGTSTEIPSDDKNVIHDFICHMS